LPIVTFSLITVCATVFLWQENLGPDASEDVAYAYGMIPSVVFGHAALAPRLALVPPWATIFTSMFLHGGWLHLLGNMLYLWLFGKGVEIALGSLRFLVFYLVCGVIAALTQGLLNVGASVPMIGASGAIAGVLGAYLLLYPRGNIVVLVWIFVLVRLFTVPALVLLGLWFLLQLSDAVAASPNQPGVAVWAHVGGFVAGMVLVPVFRQHGVRLWQSAHGPSFRATPRRARGPWG